IDTAVAIYGEDAVSSNNIGYLYSLHASCYLPRRKTTSDNYTHRTGAYSLHVEAGSLLDPNTDEWVKQPLPYGGKPRAFLAYVDTCIKTTASPNVPLGRSFSDFVELMSGSATGGAKGSINAWKTQISALAAANISFGVNFAGERARSKKVPLADEIEVWFSKDKTQLSLFPSELIVSDKYFD
ncbi:unnamed protein product, partial [Ectocarpus sp. 12 AP-2014]